MGSSSLIDRSLLTSNWKVCCLEGSRKAGGMVEVVFAKYRFKSGSF